MRLMTAYNLNIGDLGAYTAHVEGRVIDTEGREEITVDSITLDIFFGDRELCAMEFSEMINRDNYDEIIDRLQTDYLVQKSIQERVSA